MRKCENQIDFRHDLIGIVLDLPTSQGNSIWNFWNLRFCRTHFCVVPDVQTVTIHAFHFHLKTADHMKSAKKLNGKSKVAQFVLLALLATAIPKFVPLSESYAATATFENVSGQFLGFTPFVDPQSGITFSNLRNLGLGAQYFDSPTRPSLYRNNTVLISNAPGVLPNGIISWTNAFSIHGILPVSANQLGVDILYAWGVTANSAFTSGTVTLKGYGASGDLVGSISTPTIGSEVDQTHLEMVFPSSISSFDVVTNTLSTDYDNISFSTVPEPTNVLLLLMPLACFTLLRRVDWRRADKLG